MKHAQVKKHPEFVSSMRCLAVAIAGMAAISAGAIAGIAGKKKKEEEDASEEK